MSDIQNVSLNSGSGDTFEVEYIIEHRITKGREEYLVKWKDYPDSENTWEPRESFFDPTLIDEYKREREKSELISDIVNTSVQKSDTSPIGSKGGIEESSNDDNKEQSITSGFQSKTNEASIDGNARFSSETRDNNSDSKTNGNATQMLEFEKLINIRQSVDGQEYCQVKFNGIEQLQYVTIATARHYFPNALLDFYEKKCEILLGKKPSLD